MTNQPNPLHNAKRKTNMATTPQEKANPAITVAAAASSLKTRQPAQAQEGAAVKRPAMHEIMSVFTRTKLASAAVQSKPPVTKGKSGVPPLVDQDKRRGRCFYFTESRWTAPVASPLCS